MGSFPSYRNNKLLSVCHFFRMTPDMPPDILQVLKVFDKPKGVPNIDIGKS